MAERTTTRTRPRLGMRPGLMGLIILHVVVILERSRSSNTFA